MVTVSWYVCPPPWRRRCLLTRNRRHASRTIAAALLYKQSGKMRAKPAIPALACGEGVGELGDHIASAWLRRLGHATKHFAKESWQPRHEEAFQRSDPKARLLNE